jgi:hypothetical protein
MTKTGNLSFDRLGDLQYTIMDEMDSLKVSEKEFLT